MSKLSKDKRDKIILVCIGTVAVTAGIWFALLSGQRQTIVAVEKQKVEAEAQLAKGNATIKGVKDIEKEYETLSAHLKALEGGMAAPNDMYSWLIQTVNNFRAGYNVEVPAYSRETPAEVGIFAKFPYRAAIFTVRGNAYYHDFGKFLADFENNFPYIRVQNVEIDTGIELAASASNREKLAFRMDLLTLVRPIAP
jgi:Tfp pilus assembly protein PilO